MMNMGVVVGLIKALAPKADPGVIEQAVTDWLDDHPEATTTVQDGSITEEKLAQDVLADLAEISSLKEAIANDETDVLNLAKHIKADVPYVRTGTATSGSTAWAQTDTVKGIQLKKGQPYLISVTNESPVNSTVYITLANSAGTTTLKEVQLSANSSSASGTYTPAADIDNAILFFKTGLTSGVTLTTIISINDLPAPAIDVLSESAVNDLIVVKLKNATGSAKQTHKAFHFPIKAGTKIYCRTKNESEFNLLATYSDGTTGTLISEVSTEKTATPAKDVEYLGYYLAANYDDELYIYGDLYKAQLAQNQRVNNICAVSLGDFSITGYVADDGYFNGSSGALRTDYIPVENYDHCFVNTSIANSGCAIAFFNTAKQFMASASITGERYNYTCSIPEGAAYVIFSEYGFPNASGYLYIDGSVARNQIVDAENIETLRKWKRRIFDADAFGTFAKFGTCGDSMSVGYMADSGGTAHGRNIYYSWGQALARRYGNVCLNFGAAGMDTGTWFTDATYGHVQLSQDTNKCQAYIVCLGVNDSVTSENVGSTSDIDLSDYTQNEDTFYGRYAKVIQAIQAFAPTAYIFALTIPKTKGGTSYRYSELKNNAIKGVVEYIDSDNVYAIDADEYADWWQADEITDEAYSSHYTAIGYQNIASLISMMITDCMNQNSENFRDIAFVPYGNNNVIE